MRILTRILILIFQGIVIFASNDTNLLSEDYYTESTTAKATASWEREACTASYLTGNKFKT
jgi:hypothetical protein